MDPNPLATLDEYIATLRERLVAAERMRELMASNHELAHLFAPAQLAPAPGPSAPNGAPPHKPSGKHRHAYKGGPVAKAYFAQIARWMLSQSNEPKTTVDIIRGTGLPRAAVVQTLYRTHQAFFTKAKAPGSRLLLEWRLKDDVDEKVIEQETAK